MNIELIYQILQQTPGVLKKTLTGMTEPMIHGNEGPNTWSTFDVVGHLIVCEETNFMQRVHIVLSDIPDKQFYPVDMNAQYAASKGKSIGELLDRFAAVRAENITALKGYQLTDGDMDKTAHHPKLGVVTLHQLLSTWAVHDLTHIGQITRVMAKQFKENVGPFIQFLSRLQ